MNETFEIALTGDNAIGWRLGNLVAQAHPGKALLDGVGDPFDLLEFAGEGKCEASPAPGVHAEMSTHWTRAHGVQSIPINAVYDVRWNGHALRVVVAAWKVGWDRRSVSLVVADTKEIARSFVAEVSTFCNDPRRTVLVYTGGCWSKSADVFASIQRASFDELVLAGDLKERIREDFVTFLGARAEYERYGVPYKRGVLFVGPPGNGKTLCLRATIKLLEVPCLYVTSLKSRYEPEDSNIDQVFRRAREITLCCLVFEDLDAMINDKNRSFFLNQLDGINDSSGILTLATTNHPDRLDPAIVERPSRFDRKYHFALPGAIERAKFLERWNDKIDAAMRLSPGDLDRLVGETAEFSFAYLKELVLSSMVRWMVERKQGAMPAIVHGQLQSLREQMKTAHALAASAVPLSNENTEEDENE